MEITKARNNQNIIFTLNGRLDTMTAPQFEEEIKNTSFEDTETVTVNMRDLEYVSSSGLRVIMTLYKKLKSQNGSLKLVNVNSNIMELFSMTGLDEYLDIENA